MSWFRADNYWLARLVFQRGLAGIYFVAFLAAANQFRPLLGSRGMLPIPRFVERVPFRRAPSLFQLRYSDTLFAGTAWFGAVLAALTLAGVTEQAPLPLSMLAWALMWALYLSIVNVGQVWYGFGWESLLLETGFLAIFLGNADTAVPVTTMFLLRWLLFRLEVGAGLIKLRGDRCWRDLTCLYYHHETQPMPGPLSWYFHRMPRSLHKVEVVANHATQLVVPFGLFAPQPVAGTAAAIMIVTQFWLVMSGNFSWLNWLAIVLGFSVLPDGWLRHLFPISTPHHPGATPIAFVVAVLGVAALVLALSYWPVRNMLGSGQLMNASFNRWHLVNTYGAFGSVTRIRREVVIEGTADSRLGPDTEWREYEFKGKPTDLHRLPRQFAPYHLRLDWLMWFAAISRGYAQSWFEPFLGKLLQNDPATVRLLRRNPFPHRPPEYVRALLYEYRFTTWAERRQSGAWWRRTLIGQFAAPTRLVQHAR